MLYQNYRKNIIAKNLKLCTNIFTQGFGLMFRSEASVRDTAWVFIFDKPRIIAITMAFVSFPIDLLFLDDDKTVVEIKEQITPWSFYTPKSKALYCIELRAGTVKLKHIKLNDKMIF